MPTQRTANTKPGKSVRKTLTPSEARAKLDGRVRVKLTDRERELTAGLRQVMRTPTSTHYLHAFLGSLNDFVTTAMIAEAMNRIEREKAQVSPA